MRPFVYRRYLDFGVFESLRGMKEMIAREVARRELEDNIKLGPGGIREIEFITQAQQLIRGGSEPALQTPSLLAVLPRLQGARLLPAAAVAGLLDAYEFLRRTENRLQMVADQQTHALPSDELGRQRLAAAMGSAGWAEFASLLDARRRSVTSFFNDLLFGPAGRKDAVPTAGLDSLWAAEPSADLVARELAQLGILDTPAVAKMLLELRESAYYRRLDEFGRRRLAILLPLLLAGIAAATGGNRAADELSLLARLLRIVEAIGGRTAYLALLNENTSALSRLVSISRLGDYLARQVAAHPLLLDELLDSRIFETLPDREEFGSRTFDPARRTPAATRSDRWMRCGTSAAPRPFASRCRT